MQRVMINGILLVYCAGYLAFVCAAVYGAATGVVRVQPKALSAICYSAGRPC